MFKILKITTCLVQIQECMSLAHKTKILSCGQFRFTENKDIAESTKYLNFVINHLLSAVNLIKLTIYFLIRFWPLCFVAK